jgi:hypothetical protein
MILDLIGWLLVGGSVAGFTAMLTRASRTTDGPDHVRLDSRPVEEVIPEISWRWQDGTDTDRVQLYRPGDARWPEVPGDPIDELFGDRR